MAEAKKKRREERKDEEKEIRPFKVLKDCVEIG